MGWVRGSEVMMYVRPVMSEGRGGRNEGGQGGGVTMMRVDRDNGMVRILVMRERMRSGMVMVRRLSGGLEMGRRMIVMVMRDCRYRCGGVVNNG